MKRNRRNRDDNITKFSVKIPSLQGLLYVSDDIISSLPDDDEVVDTGKCLAIDTPGLLYFSITDHSGDSCSIENMPCLEDASIDVKSFSDMDKSKTYLSAVRSLVLHTTDQVVALYLFICVTNMLVVVTLLHIINCICCRLFRFSFCLLAQSSSLDL